MGFSFLQPEKMLMEIRILLTLFKVKKRREKELPELKGDLYVRGAQRPPAAARRLPSGPEA